MVPNYQRWYNKEKKGENKSPFYGHQEIIASQFRVQHTYEEDVEPQ
jgi:hypothetical protein